MNTKRVMWGFAVCLLAVAAWAADNPNLGTWKLNEAKSKIAAGSGKNTTVVYSAEGDNFKVTTDGVTKDGQPAHGEWVGKFDGKFYPVTGDPNTDERSYKKVNDRTMELTNRKGGKVTTTGRLEIARDGKSRTLVTHGTSDGKAVENRYVYDKE